MPKGVYARSPERLGQLQEQIKIVRAAPDWSQKVSKGQFQKGVAHPNRVSWTPERRAEHGKIMARVGVITKLLRRRNASPWEVRLRSDLESLGLTWQVKIDGVGVADYADSERKVAVEFEQGFFNEAGNSRGAKKLRAYQSLGWRCLTFSYWHVKDYPVHVMECVRNALIQRGT